MESYNITTWVTNAGVGPTLSKYKYFVTEHHLEFAEPARTRECGPPTKKFALPCAMQSTSPSYHENLVIFEMIKWQK